MRQIVLDTETTGLSWEKGNRVVEIGCIELVERRTTGRHFHCYLNPQREMEQGAQEVTGLSLEFLSDKPLFESVVDEFLDFIAGAELVIHNAAFDVGFLNNELKLAGPQFGSLADHCEMLDTLALARERYPGQRNSLDALCKRLGVDNGHRKLHGALLDAELLAEVYLALTGGQGEMALMLADEGRDSVEGEVVVAITAAARKVVRATEDDLALHRARIERIAAKSGGKGVWSVS